jgi:hypothetical protein
VCNRGRCNDLSSERIGCQRAGCECVTGDVSMWNRFVDTERQANPLNRPIRTLLHLFEDGRRPGSWRQTPDSQSYRLRSTLLGLLSLSLPLVSFVDLLSSPIPRLGLDPCRQCTPLLGMIRCVLHASPRFDSVYAVRRVVGMGWVE